MALDAVVRRVGARHDGARRLGGVGAGGSPAHPRRYSPGLTSSFPALTHAILRRDEARSHPPRAARADNDERLDSRAGEAAQSRSVEAAIGSARFAGRDLLGTRGNANPI